jgi:hypothetical protein
MTGRFLHGLGSDDTYLRGMDIQRDSEMMLSEGTRTLKKRKRNLAQCSADNHPG